jgi:hypothetical protein
MFMARSAFLRENGYPDRGMIKGADDIAIGELILQADGKLLAFPPELAAMFRSNTGERRGTGIGFQDGWVAT